MKLSIIVSYYNQEKYVERSLSSIFLMNLPFEYEVIIGDDGSQDSTLEKIKEWKNKFPNNIHYYVMEREANVEHHPNERNSEIKRKGLSLAKGEYVCFLDGDDFFENKEKFIKSIHILDLNKNVSVLATNFYYYYNENKKIKAVSSYIKNGIIAKKDYWRYMYFHPLSIVYRNIFLVKKNNIPHGFFDDNLITFAFLQYGDIYFLNEITGDYCQNEDGIWAGCSSLLHNYLLDLMDFEMASRLNPKLKKILYYRYRQPMQKLKEEIIRNKVKYKDLKEYDKRRLENNNLKYSSDFVINPPKYIKKNLFYSLRKRILKLFRRL